MTPVSKTKHFSFLGWQRVHGLEKNLYIMTQLQDISPQMNLKMELEREVRISQPRDTALALKCA
jgi:hypothetical protein